MARKDEADGAPTSMVEPFTRPDGYVQVPDPWTRVTGTGDRGRPERQRRARPRLEHDCGGRRDGSALDEIFRYIRAHPDEFAPLRWTFALGCDAAHMT
jgi:hypothetical protein